jgi:hypothetical protein
MSKPKTDNKSCLKVLILSCGLTELVLAMYGFCGFISISLAMLVGVIILVIHDSMEHVKE